MGTRPGFRALGVFLLIVASAASGFFLYALMTPGKSRAPVATQVSALPQTGVEMIGKRRPSFTLPDFHGEMRDVSEWDGKLLVLNFWATWCAPCLEEIPMFVSMQARYGERGVQFVGVAIDGREQVRDFAARVGLNYPSIQHPTATLDLLRIYGNVQGGLPYTVIVSAEGRIVFTRLGAFSREEIEALIQDHLAG